MHSPKPYAASLGLPAVRNLQKPPPTSPRPVLDTQSLTQACRDPTHPQAVQLRYSRTQWTDSHPHASVEEVDAALLDAAHHALPGKIHHGRVVPWQAPQAALSVREMWKTYRAWGHATSGRPGALTIAWAAYAGVC